MRNLTQEAIEFAESSLIQINSQLANKQFREQLLSMNKMIVVSQLQMIYDRYMEELIEEIRYGKQT